ncbi:MAG TPA: hypothetical protein VN890_09550 [Methylocella sp.]|nr:hypothetical protein [Methylocella sp.]
MATLSLPSLFSNAARFVGTDARSLGGAIIEVVPPLMQNGRFSVDTLLNPLYQPDGRAYPQSRRRPVILAFAEALSWLTAQGLIVIDPEHSYPYYTLTRRASDLRTRADVEAFRKGGILPEDIVLLKRSCHYFVAVITTLWSSKL